MLGLLHFNSLQPIDKFTNVLLCKKGCYLEALTHSSRNQGVDGAAEKGRGETLLFASEVRIAAFLPKSINCGGGGRERRIPASGRGGIFFLLLLVSARS